MKTLLAILLLIAVAGCEQSSPAPRIKQPKAATREVLDFCATWCGPCKANDPSVKRLEKSGVKVRRIDIDAKPSMAERYNISAVPTYIILENGQEVDRTHEIGRLTQLKSWLLGKRTQLPEAPTPKRQPPPRSPGINDLLWGVPPYGRL